MDIKIDINFVSLLNDSSFKVKSSTCGYNSDLYSIFFNDYFYRLWFKLGAFKFSDNYNLIPYYNHKIIWNQYLALEKLNVTAGYISNKLSNNYILKDEIYIQFYKRKINNIKIIFDPFIFATEFEIILSALNENDHIYKKYVKNDKYEINIKIDFNYEIKYIILKFYKLNKNNRRLVINNIIIGYNLIFYSDHIHNLNLDYDKGINEDNFAGIIYKNLTLSLWNKYNIEYFFNNTLKILNFYIKKDNIWEIFDNFVINNINNKNNNLIHIKAISILKYYSSQQIQQKLINNTDLVKEVKNIAKDLGVNKIINQNTYIKLPFYYVNNNISISKLLLSFAKASNSIVNINKDIMYFLNINYLFCLKRAGILNKILEINKDDFKNVNSYFYKYKKMIISYNEKVFNKEFFLKDLPLSNIDNINIYNNENIYSIGYNLTSYNIDLLFSEISIIKNNYIRTELTQDFKKGYFEYEIVELNDRIRIKLWRFFILENNQDAFLIRIIYNSNQDKEIYNYIDKIPNNFKARLYYINDNNLNLEERYEFIKSYNININIDKNIIFSSFIVKPSQIKGQFEYKIIENSDGFIIKVYNLTNREQNLNIIVYGKKVKYDNNEEIIEYKDYKNILDNYEIKKEFDNIEYLQNKDHIKKILKENLILNSFIEKKIKIKIKPNKLKLLQSRYINTIILIKDKREYTALLVERENIILNASDYFVNLEGRSLNKGIFREKTLDNFVINYDILN